MVSGEASVFSAYGSVFRDNTAVLGSSVFYMMDGARGSMTDCLVIGNSVLGGVEAGAISLMTESTMSVLRTTFEDNRATQTGGCFAVHRLATLLIDQSVILNCSTDGAGGMLIMPGPGGSVTIANSRMVGNEGGKSGLAVLREGSAAFLRITGSTISGTRSGVGEFAIEIEGTTAPDFFLQLDTVVVDESVDIFSHSKVLLQNCEGFNSMAVQNASVGTCQSTTDYCLAESCADDHVGIDCICDIDGVPNPFPTDGMQSAIIEARGLFECDPAPSMNAFGVFCPHHTGPSTVDAYSHIYHFKAVHRDGRVGPFKRACVPISESWGCALTSCISIC